MPGSWLGGFGTVIAGVMALNEFGEIAHDEWLKSARIRREIEVERDCLPSPLLYLSAFFEAARGEYYDHLLGVSERGAWAAWLRYFLTGVAYTTAQGAVEKLEPLAILARTTDTRRDWVYCAEAILDILEELADLTPWEEHQ